VRAPNICILLATALAAAVLIHPPLRAQDASDSHSVAEGTSDAQIGIPDTAESQISSEARELITRDQFIDMLRIRAPEEGYAEKRIRTMDTEEKKPARVTVNILFKVGSTELAGDFSIRQIQEAGEALSSEDLAGYRFEIAGHTDNTGSEGDNLSLSRERAQAVKDFLVEFYGIDPDRLVARGYGESQPVASNATEEGRARNRRVVFTRIDEYK
jgi:outer membrane protein OmpA-like peptidoglycan-associated protein